MSNKKILVGVLMGGPSAEREISLLTGQAVTRNLDPNKYRVLPIEMSKDGQLKLLNERDIKSIKYGDKKQSQSLSICGQNSADYAWQEKKMDMVFIAMHGTYGEDGCLQGMLESLNIPYTGSKVLASALAMDKVKSAEIYRANGLPTPDFINFTAQECQKKLSEIVKRVVKLFGFPVVIKPTNQGSAVGVFIPKNRQELISAIKTNSRKFSHLMAQKFIKGREATCGVLEKKGQPFALPPTRIVANKGNFYDYKSKYDAGGSTHICPADFTPKVNKELQNLAVKAHKALGCRGMSRTDIFVSDDEKLYIIETNTIPGMASTSLFPEEASKIGIGFSKMLDLIIEASQ